MEDALQLIEFSEKTRQMNEVHTMTCKSIPSILNRKRKLATKPAMNDENQENPEVVVVYEVLESPMPSRFPLHPIPIGSNFLHRKNLSSGVPKIKSKLRLRESWKR